MLFDPTPLCFAIYPIYPFIFSKRSIVTCLLMFFYFILSFANFTALLSISLCIFRVLFCLPINYVIIFYINYFIIIYHLIIFHKNASKHRSKICSHAFVRSGYRLPRELVCQCTTYLFTIDL